MFKELAKSGPHVNIVRIFEDGDHVFAHTEYDFARSNIGFEIFRFEGDQAVEHWDNIQLRAGPNPSGHSMVDGHTEVADLDETEFNRETISAFVDEVLIRGELDRLSEYVEAGVYTEHNPRLGDDLSELRSALSALASGEVASIQYRHCHRILAEGNFVLSVCEGDFNGAHTSFFDLFRLVNSRIVEHWDTTETIPPHSEWKNENGKF